MHAANGEIAWHFQTTPGDNWDYDATRPLMQADLMIGGKQRKVIMQANKNGFFYVLDRATGEFILGAAFVKGVSWASGLDAQGRPMELAAGSAGLKPMIVSPDPSGAHNWNPMAFHPATGLVYLSAKTYTEFVHPPDKKWKYDPESVNLGIDTYYDGPLYGDMAKMPAPQGSLLAWDPVAQKAVWSASYPVAEGGGVLATGGNLVFQGRADGIFAAYRATDGKQLWQFDAQTGIIAPPVTYTIDGTQYVTVMAGWGGSSGLFNSPAQGKVRPGYGRIVTFALDAKATLNVPPYGHKEPPHPAITMNAPKETVHLGQLLYATHCADCHGINVVAGPTPDLRYASQDVHDQFEKIVLGGARASQGMPSFARILKPDQVRAIEAYILSRAAEKN